MNQKEFDELVKEAQKKFDDKQLEFDAMLDALIRKQEELDRFRDDLLLNLMNVDESAGDTEDEEYEEDEEEETLDQSLSMSFITETPDPEELGECKAVVVHFKNCLGNDKNDSEDGNYFVSVERGADLKIGAIACAYGMIEACLTEIIDSVPANVASKYLDCIDKDEIAAELLEKLADDLLSAIFKFALEKQRRMTND